MTYKAWLIALALAAPIVGCGSAPPAVRMVGSMDVPAARGTVTASRIGNQNTSLGVDVRHLAAPDRVEPGATTFVVWARGFGQEDFQNLGALRVDANLRGTLKTLTPYSTFEVVVTAEPSPTATTPSGKRLLTASVRPPSG